jgi:NAD(P)-dependent dehydrogenase (short-subunit alcohol dehydrogenase family)
MTLSDSSTGAAGTGLPRPLESKVAIVTGARRGIGRTYAVHMARLGAKVILNDLGTSRRGDGSETAVADAAVDKIRSEGGVAVADSHDVGDWESARGLIQHAIDEFGRLDVLVNNASVTRDNSVADLTEDDWDSVIRVHLKGTIATVHHAVSHWKREHEAGRRPRASVINTSSRAGTLPDRDQGVRPNYVAAKAAIAALGQVASYELHRYGVRINTICPMGLTQGMATAFGQTERWREPEDYTEFDEFNPANNAPLVAWLASDLSAHVTGQVFQVLFGKEIIHVEPWRFGTAIAANGHLDDIETIAERMDMEVFGCRERVPENIVRLELEATARRVRV